MTTAIKEVNIMDLMNRNFYSFWLNEKPHSILSGGRSSMKSSVISLKLVIDFLGMTAPSRGLSFISLSNSIFKYHISASVDATNCCLGIFLLKAETSTIIVTYDVDQEKVIFLRTANRDELK